MKKVLVALTAVALFSGTAHAADLPRPYVKAPPPRAAVVNWTGCYVGGGGGYGLFRQQNTEFVEPHSIVAPAFTVRTQVSGTADAGGSGWFGTVQGGCDYQFAGPLGNWVIGAFADYDFASIKGQLNPPGDTLFGQEKLTDKWSVGGRLGYLIMPNVLTYFSAGYTEARYDRVNLELILTQNLQPAAIVPGFGRYWNSTWYKGWFIGSGYEYALGFLPGLFWKTEYRFSEYDLKTNATYFAPTYFSVADRNQLTGSTYDSRKYDQTIRTELVYRFNWGGPLVAKY
jgi:outer membrane immunogenic protein